MKRSNTYLIFDGNCAQAMKFYARCLGAELHLMPFSEMPGEVSKEAKDRIMHAKLTKGDMTWMASDNHPDHTAVPFKQGNNFLINLDCESVQEIDRLFAAFSDQGKITMPLQETFWAARFGILTDRFGVNWMFNLDKPAQG